MSRTSKSPRKVALEALAAARQALPSYGSRFSRHDFTLAQHFACLVLKSFFRTDYRGVSAILADWPHHSTRSSSRWPCACTIPPASWLTPKKCHPPSWTFRWGTGEEERV